MLDTGAVIAVFDHDDARHADAVAFLDDVIVPYNCRVYSTCLIYQETLTRLHSRMHSGLPKKHFDQARELLRDDTFLTELSVSRDVLEAAVDVMVSGGDQRFSMVDATTFVLMEQQRIPAAFSFDDDFKAYSWKIGHEQRPILKLPEQEYLLRFED